jgi:hypothetical protein
VIRKLVFTYCLATGVLLAQNATPVSVQAQAPAPKTPARSHFHAPMSNHAVNYYFLRWGVDSFSAKLVESGELVRFSWRVIDPAKATPLHDKKVTPFMVDPRAQVKLDIPSLEKVGQLRQTSAPEQGKSYWMAFSNKGRPVKKGDRVTVVIGNFRVDGVLVE